MAIKYHPDAGEILICDFKGLNPPEMVKKRPVINLTPRYRRSGGLCLVVPLSTTAPDPVQLWHRRLHVNLPAPYQNPEVWIKGDFLYTVSYERLFPFFQGKDQSGKRQYVYPALTPKELDAVWRCVLYGMGRSDIVKMLDEAKAVA